VVLSGGVQRPANADAKALSLYLGAMGLDVSPARISDLLVLVAVFVLEMGPGLYLTLAMALSAQPTPVRRV
jgi:hypothetical protein